MAKVLVAGESAQAVLDIVKEASFDPMGDGNVNFSLFMEPDQAGPFVRALMRIEAELLIEEAATFGSSRDQLRSSDARQLHAFQLLIMRVTTALRG